MILPQLVKDTRTSIFYFLVGGVATITLYQLTNRVHLFEPQLLQMGWVDEQIPLVPWTLWVYFTEYIIFICAWLMLPDHAGRTRFFYSYMSILLISIFIFIFFPTTFPRADFPLDGFPQTFTVTLFEYFRANMDTPANCVPSLHVSSCYVSAFMFVRYSAKKFWFFFIWATAVAISTMTTKQHYFVDVWTAMLLTLFCSYVFGLYAELSTSVKRPVFQWRPVLDPIRAYLRRD